MIIVWFIRAVFRWPSRSMSEKLRPSMMWSSGSFTSQSARLRKRSLRSIPWDVESADSTAQSWQVCSKTGAFCLASMRNPPQETHGARAQARCCNQRGRKKNTNDQPSTVVAKRVMTAPANPTGAVGAFPYHDMKAAANATQAPIPRTTTAPTRQPIAAPDPLHGQQTPRLAKLPCTQSMQRIPL